MIAHALAYVARGWRIFPCWERDETESEFEARLERMPEDKKKGAIPWKAKQPRVAGGLKSASKDPEQIKSWWGKWPGASIGCPTGPNIGAWVLDVDLPDGPATLARLEAENGPLPSTARQRTGSGGLHLFFAYPTDGREIKNSAGKIGPGIDVRGVGGYVILPPSMHPSGGTYEWINEKLLGVLDA